MSALLLRDVWKTFGSVVANAGVELEVADGEIHAIVGENGAGKSTLMKLIAGLYAPDRGTIQVHGKDVTGWSTADAIAAGVGMVHQHFMLVPTLTVAENIILGREPKKGIALDLDRAKREVEALCAESGLRVEADRLVGELPVGLAQRVEILKTLYRGARLLILDEPTAVLSPPEVAEFLRVLAKLRDKGTTIVMITHKLAEVMKASDRITVIRRGKTVAMMTTKETTPPEIARAMVGRDVVLPGDEKPTKPREIASDAKPALEVRSLRVVGNRGTTAVDDLSFSVRPGEVLGIAGVEGNGQTELVEAIAGLRSIAGGSIHIGGVDASKLRVREREAAGLAHIPEDRHRRGLVLEFTVAENLVLGRVDRFTRTGLIEGDKLMRHAKERIADFDIRPADPDLFAGALSGGNQQKIVIAREMHDFRVLVASQPTRGVDVGAIEFIHARLRAARDAGKAVLLVSAELPEVLALSDRVAVLFGGRFVTVMPRAEASIEVLGPYMTGASSKARAAEADSKEAS